MGTAACLALLGLRSAPPLLAKDRPPETFYYLAVPSCGGKCLFFATLQFDRQGKLVQAPQKKTPFFTLWRSGYWDEKAPDPFVKNLEDWKKTLELRAQKTVAAKQEMGGLPAPIVDFFVAVETLRAAALDQPLVLQPLFQTKDFVGWENGTHLNVLAVPDTVGAKERSKALLRTMGALSKEETQDPAQWMKTLLIHFGAKVQSVRYWPEYNVFLFEADGEFKETMETIFSPMAMERSGLPVMAGYAMLPRL